MASPPPPRIISPGGPQRQPSLPDLSSTASPTSPSSSSSSAVQARTSYFAGAHSNTIPSPSNPHSTTSPEHADTSEYDDGSHERAEAALQAAAQYSERQDEEHIYGEQQHSSSYDFSRSPEPSDHILPPQASGSPSASTSISSSDFSRSSRALYASYFFAAWGDRMWEFAAIIFLIDLFPSSLLYSSVFGLVEKLAGIAAGPEIGRAVDQSDRLSLVRWTILGQNGSVCFASVLFWAALSSITLAPDGTNPNSPDARTVVSYLFILVMGAIAAVASMANKVAIHKDWVVVICGEDDTRLTRLNSNMRRIDLGCSVLAPLLVGLLSIASSSTAVGCVAVWSAVSLVVEYHLIGWVYERIPALQGKSERFQERERAKREASQRQQPEEIAADEHRLPPPRIDVEDPSTNPVRIEDVELPMHLRVLHRSKRFLVTFKDEMRAYYAHPVFLASLAYALLYISVLSLGGIMAAWLKIQGVSNTVIAVVRGIAASVGIASTYCVPWMIARWGLLRAGLVAVWSQAAMLLPVAFSFVYYFRDSSIQLVILFLFLCLSRFGLWSFDLCETQLMQLQVSREHAGVINGSQETLVNVGYIVSFLLTIIFSSPELFAIPAWISFLAVVVSAVCYTNYAGRELGTENPFPPLETFKLHRKVQYDPAMDGLSQQHAEGEEEQKANHGGQYEEHLAPQQQLEDGASMSTEEAASTDPSVFGGRSSYVHHGSYVSASYGESDL